MTRARTLAERVAAIDGVQVSGTFMRHAAQDAMPSRAAMAVVGANRSP